MGVFDRIKAAVSRKPRAGTGLEVARWKQAPPRRGSRELIQAYKEMPWLATIVDTAADSVGAACWKVVRRVKNGRSVKDFSLRSAPMESRWRRLNGLADAGELEEQLDHPLLQLLTDPNDYFTAPQFWSLVDKYLDLVGEAFLAMERVGKVPVGLWAIPAHAVTRLPDLSKPKNERTYTVNMGGMVADVAGDAVIHLRHLDPDDPLGRGIGRAFALGDELDSDEYVARFVKNSFFNSMVPPFIAGIKGAGDTAKGAAERFKEELTRKHGGPDNAGKLMITNGEVTIARLDTTFKDLALVEVRKFLMDFVRMVYRVPPEIVGDITSSNKATSYAALEHFAKQVTVPRLEFLRAALQKWLLPLFDSTGADILDFESPVPADREHQIRVMGTMPEAFSFDEWRAAGGFKPHPEKTGFPMPPPGAKPGGQQTPDPEPGGAAEGAEEGKKGDPPWATQLSAPLP